MSESHGERVQRMIDNIRWLSDGVIRNRVADYGAKSPAALGRYQRAILVEAERRGITANDEDDD